MIVSFESRENFKLTISNELVENTSIVSISDSIQEMNEMTALIEANGFTMGSNAIALSFLDVESEDYPLTAIDQNQAKQLFQFINNNAGNDFKIHCFLGVSRSAAVAKFIDEHFSLNQHNLKHYNIYNKTVYNQLKAASGDEYELYKLALREADEFGF